MPRYTDPETGKSIFSETSLTESEITQGLNLTRTPTTTPIPSPTPSPIPIPPPEKPFLPTMISKIPESGVEFLKSMITPIAHPIQTAKGLGATGFGFIQKLIPGEQEDEKYADAMIDFMKQRYGGIENIKKTVRDDPVGVMADLATILTGVGGIGRATLSATGRAGRVAKAVSEVGRAIEPLSIATKTLGVPLSFLQKKVAAPALGLTTGVGGETVRRSMIPTETFRRALRGKISPEEVVAQERSALNLLKHERSQEYVGKLGQVQQMQNIINITPVKQELARFMSPSRFNITRTAQGKLDFSRSTIQKSARRDAMEIINKVENWGTRPDDLTPRGLDILKRQLDDFYTENKNTRAMVEGLRDKTKNLLTRNVPEYGTMTRGYEKATKIINEIQKDMALGTKSSMSQGITRLRTALRDDAEFRRGLVQTLEKTGGTELLDAIAGSTMKTWIPSAGTHAGLAGRIAAGGLFTTLFGVTPEALAIIGSTSPRTIAELNNVISRAVQLERKIPRELVPGLFQVGRMEREVIK